MAAGRPDTGRDDPVLADLLAEIRGMRLDLRNFGERMAAHPEAPEVRNALERLRVVEEREIARQKSVEKLEAKVEALERDVQNLKTGSAVGGVTITGVHKVAGAVLGLIMLAVVWLAGRATAPPPTPSPPPAQATQAAP
jgi:ribosomal protein L29